MDHYNSYAPTGPTSQYPPTYPDRPTASPEYAYQSSFPTYPPQPSQTVSSPQWPTPSRTEYAPSPALTDQYSTGYPVPQSTAGYSQYTPTTYQPSYTSHPSTPYTPPAQTSSYPPSQPSYPTQAPYPQPQTSYPSTQTSSYPSTQTDTYTPTQTYSEGTSYPYGTGVPPRQSSHRPYVPTGEQYPPPRAEISTPNMRAMSPPLTGPKPQPQQSAQQPQQQRTKDERIDQKQIPRPKEGKVGEVLKYYTRSGHAPPPAHSEYIVVDEGNCSPRFMRFTTYQIANDTELIDRTKLCIGAIIQPLAEPGPQEEPIQVVKFTDDKIVRCVRCKAYVNPFFKFVDGGHSFICNICYMKNDVPDDYKCNLDAHGLRRDRHERPELNRGSVEFVAGKEFYLREIQDPSYLFVIDVSYSAVVTGLVDVACAGIRQCLDSLAENKRARIGVVTYDHHIQFYSIQPEKEEPSILVMSDIESVFLPIPHDQILVRPSDRRNRTVLEALLDMLPRIYHKDRVTSPGSTTSGESSSSEMGNCAGAAARVAAKALKPTGGKMFLLISNLPTLGAGSLKPRDNVNLYFTKKEKTLFEPQDVFYTTVSSRCAEHRIAVDLFVCANSYVDLATVGSLSTKTGGQIFLYPGFNARKDGESLAADISRDLTRPHGFDGVMIVRVSTGLKVSDYYGNFFHRRPNELDLPSLDCDKAFGIRLEHEGKLEDKTDVSFQCALLYTTSKGERRIRVHTLSLPVTTTMTNIFRSSDLDAIINLSLKQAVRQIFTTTSPEDGQKALISACVESLYVYRKFCATSSMAGQLILPEPLKLLPLCTLGLIKHPLFQAGLAADERSFLYAYAASMPAYVSVAFVCPRLFNLTTIPDHACLRNKDGRIFLPPNLTLSSASLSSSGMFLLDDSRYFYLWIGQDVDPALVKAVFGYDRDGEGKAYTQQECKLVPFNPSDPHTLSSKIHVLLERLRQNKSNFQSLQLLARSFTMKSGVLSPTPESTGDLGLGAGLSQLQLQETLDEKIFLNHLIEDQSREKLSASRSPSTGSGTGDEDHRPPHLMSYIDFLCWIHKKIQNKFRVG